MQQGAPSFAMINSGHIRILNRPYVSNALYLDSIRLEDNACARIQILTLQVFQDKNTSET